uniref:VanZ-like domain-containing protein n=1 Tax=Streptomyces avermitilis TaxID=33903 RepID=A0A499W1B4_STRAX|nr:hypothetical protein SAVMC3_84300 [Streptomyces avermitilis]
MARTELRTGTSKFGLGRRRTSTAPPPEHRPLPLPVRLLAMVLAFATMVAFAAVLARLTLEPSPASEALTHNNLHPGRSLHAYLSRPELRDAVKQIGGNLLLGVPFGVLLPMVAPRTRGLVRVGVLTALVMLLVELVQGRSSPGAPSTSTTSSSTRRARCWVICCWGGDSGGPCIRAGGGGRTRAAARARAEQLLVRTTDLTTPYLIP